LTTGQKIFTSNVRQGSFKDATVSSAAGKLIEFNYEYQRSQKSLQTPACAPRQRIEVWLTGMSGHYDENLQVQADYAKR
jgi:hypothetical protein